MRTALAILSTLAIVTLLTAVPSGSAQLDRMAELERRVSDLELDRKLISSDINQLKSIASTTWIRSRVFRIPWTICARMWTMARPR